MVVRWLHWFVVNLIKGSHLISIVQFLEKLFYLIQGLQKGMKNIANCLFSVLKRIKSLWPICGWHNSNLRSYKTYFAIRLCLLRFSCFLLTTISKEWSMYCSSGLAWYWHIICRWRLYCLQVKVTSAGEGHIVYRWRLHCLQVKVILHAGEGYIACRWRLYCMQMKVTSAGEDHIVCRWRSYCLQVKVTLPAGKGYIAYRWRSYCLQVKVTLPIDEGYIACK